ncbi:MAG: PepSY-associated TM helix domain-containing protein [Planctomycetes bacterium]|nr:PepSY-associated TM helix domain-containing protein [Planctomycetota bacterium]
MFEESADHQGTAIPKRFKIGPHLNASGTAAIRPHRRPIQHWLRRVHTWVSLGIALPLLLLCVTGILLNHKDALLPKPGLAPQMYATAAQAGTAKAPLRGLTAQGNLDDLPVTFKQAMELAAKRLDSAPIEKIELRNEKGRWLYKIKTDKTLTADREVIIDVDTGEFSEKAAGGVKTAGTDRVDADWPALVRELHNGKILGAPGSVLLTILAVAIIISVLTGFLIWLLKCFRRPRPTDIRQNNLKGETQCG